MNTITKAELDALELLEKAATPGPWRCGISGNPRVYGPDDSPGAGPLLTTLWRPDPYEVRGNCDFIAESRNALPRLIADHRRLVELLARLFEDAHRKGCLWLDDRRMPCQCGATERINETVGEAKRYLRQWEGNT